MVNSSLSIKTVLVVDDERNVVSFLSEMLTLKGYTVYSAEGAREALEICAEMTGRLDLLLSDVVMPYMNGKELASRISALSPGVIVLFSSGYGENIISRHGVVQAGINFIAKPYRPRELARKVRELLDQRLTQPLDQR